VPYLERLAPQCLARQAVISHTACQPDMPLCFSCRRGRPTAPAVGRLDSTRPREISPVPANAREIPLRLLPSDAVVGWQWIPANRLRTLFCRRDGAQEPTLEFYPACCLLNIYCTVALSDYVLIFIVRQQHVQCLDVFCITYRAISAYFADANCGKLLFAVGDTILF